jgi:serine/threonine-protein kinase
MTDYSEPPSNIGSTSSAVGLPRIGTVFAGYGLEGVLGRGGMSVVYRADNVRLGNKIALKVLMPELSENDAFRERFVRESRVAASINHPNIIPIYDAGDENGLLYIVMRYVEGADLKALVRRAGPLDVTRACMLVTQVAGALHAAHESGLIHRDIKPGNILIDRIDDGIQVLEHVYLADFGLTKHAQSRSGLTHTGQFVGTVDYVAPEQIEGRPVDKRADVYSLGCVLFECLTGVVPFHRESDVAVLWAHVQESCPPITSLRSDLPVGMDEVVERAMAKAPDDRYQTAAEFAADLSRVARTAASRGPVSGIASAASTSALGSTAGAPQQAGGSTPGAPPGGTAPATAEDEAVTRMPGRAKRSVQGVVAALVLVVVLAAAGLFALSRSGSHSASGGGSTSQGSTKQNTTPAAAGGFPQNTTSLRRVMAPSLLGQNQCQSTKTPIKGVPQAIGAQAVEGVTCVGTKNSFQTVQYSVFLYRDTATLKAVFASILTAWQNSGNWQQSLQACHTSNGSVWAGGPVAWHHPQEVQGQPPPLGGHRACYGHLSQNLMVWTHQRSNPTPQSDHYDTLVAATLTTATTLPTELRRFWRYQQVQTTPIGKALNGQPLPPLQ